MTWLYVWLLSIYVHAYDGRISVLKLTNIYVCPDTDNRVKVHDTVLQNINDDGFKTFTGTVELPFEFNEEFEYELRVDKFNHGDWQDDVYSREGNVCEDAKVFVPEAWKRLVNLTEPPFETECLAHPGTYKLNNIEIFRNELKLPGMLYGYVRVTIKLFDSSGEEMFCVISEIKL